MVEKTFDPKCPFCNESVSDTAGEYGLLVHLDSECEGNFATRPIENELRVEIKQLKEDNVHANDCACKLGNKLEKMKEALKDCLEQINE